MDKKTGPPKAALRFVPEGELVMEKYRGLFAATEAAIGTSTFKENFDKLVKLCFGQRNLTGRFFSPPGTVGKLEERHNDAMVAGRKQTLFDEIETSLGTPGFADTLAMVVPQLLSMGVSQTIIDGFSGCHTRMRIHNRRVAQQSMDFLTKWKDKTAFHRKKWEQEVGKRTLFAALVKHFLTLHRPIVGTSDQKEGREEGAKILRFPGLQQPVVPGLLATGT